jgi:hypothetical protein
MRPLLVFLALACLAVLLAAGSAPAQRSDCTWGASSVLVQDVNGTLVQSDPVTTGCVPR